MTKSPSKAPKFTETAEESQGVKRPVDYLVSEKKNLKFISTGCTVLNCALGGGLALGRMANIVGDKSTAKSALANEIIINFLMAYPKGRAGYRETEAAFDRDYAAAMGMPVDKVDFGNPEEPLMTAEAFIRDLDLFVDDQKRADNSGVYILDSFDALSDEAELEADIAKGTYGTAKSKLTSSMFRRLARRIEASEVSLIIVSQVRENINAMFGERYRRSGGKALDFYASQIIWLAHIKTLKKTVNKVERPYAITITAKIKKNKVGLPLREATFDYIFGYGVDDLLASLNWLKAVNRLGAAGYKVNDYKELLESIAEMNDEEYHKTQQAVATVVKEVWREIETSFLPVRQKYKW